MLKINLSKQAEKFLNQLNKKDKDSAKEVTKKILALCLEPKPQGSKILVGSSDFRRIRIAKFRVIYKFDKINLFITYIDKRDKIYKNLN